jgi:ketosteroid isomerase-like protein
MTDESREHALTPQDLSRLLVERLNAGDVHGLVALYEPDAVLALPDGSIAKGWSEIRIAYQHIISILPHVEPGRQQLPLHYRDLALTSTLLSNGDTTAEVARRQPDGTWRWVLDQPVVAQHKSRHRRHLSADEAPD